MNRHQRRRAEALQRKPRYLRYYDLEADGIVPNRMTLSRWIAGNSGFPKPVRLGPNTVAWKTEEVEAWLTERERASDCA
jgi:predicted DNA-binding transcriptional regulator AlpA